MSGKAKKEIKTCGANNMGYGLEYTKCNLCGSGSYDILQNPDSFRIVKCKKCGLIYVNPRPDQKYIKEFYSKTSNYAEWHKQKEGREKMWEKRVKELVGVANENNIQKGSILDIGCGIGTFLSMMKDKGWRCSGTEISEIALDSLERGIDVFVGPIENMKPNKRFDIITIWHVLEHLPDPLKTLNKANSLLKDEGMIVVAVPNAEERIFLFLKTTIRMKRQYLFSKDSKEIHLYHFSQSSLRKMMEKAGFTIIKEAVDTPGITFARRFFDDIAGFVFRITGKNIGIALKIYAKKQ
ncbi:hypothetical protein COV19_05525 [Candidatus Woesearchaeota archaeon CG10_big_fil_rev_8_21_14_0_10_44_13]|nr:MAG: hypothetical protein COV19_05525 [Candidatus Woesearchaeota archaeon CG10_big_fil_rev_8_21_14_0_10_44_13]